MPFGGVGYIMSIGLFKALAALQGGAGLRAYEVRGAGLHRERGVLQGQEVLAGRQLQDHNGSSRTKLRGDQPRGRHPCTRARTELRRHYVWSSCTSPRLLQERVPRCTSCPPQRCIGATSVTSFPQGGDAFLSRCLWRLGFPITDPGYTPLGR